jgi:cysteine-rich secretory protein family./fibronectin type III domain
MYKAVSKQITVTVKPKKMKIVSSSSAAKSTVNIKWKKDSSVDGYEILVATDKKFSKNKNKYTIKSKNKATKKITNLKSGKKYYVKIRSYKIINKKKIYSAYSSAENLIVK